MDNVNTKGSSGDRSPRSRAGHSIFERWSDDDVAALVRAYPLAWVVPAGGTALEASLLPLLLVRDEDGRPLHLVGHLALGNPLAAVLAGDGRVQILFTGPQGYVSPEFVADRSWAPTWNYAQVRMEAVLSLTPAATPDTVEQLVGAMEAGRPDPWSTAEMGGRYDRMMTAIVGFTAAITRVEARFKLGQDERPETLRQIMAAHPDRELVAWMERFAAPASPPQP